MVNSWTQATSGRRWCQFKLITVSCFSFHGPLSNKMRHSTWKRRFQDQKSTFLPVCKEELKQGCKTWKCNVNDSSCIIEVAWVKFWNKLWHFQCCQFDQSKNLSFCKSGGKRAAVGHWGWGGVRKRGGGHWGWECWTMHHSTSRQHAPTAQLGPTPPKMWAVTVRQLEKHAAVLCCRHFLVFA